METLANLESFVRAAQHGSFSEAARMLSLTPAAVSRNVAVLERNLGVRLFQRSTRKLTLTEAGESFRAAIAGNLEVLQAAIAGVTANSSEPAGTLKLSVPPGLGVTYLLPMVKGFVARYPRIRPDIHFENRQVDLIAEGYDAAIGGGFELLPGMVSRTLAPAHLVAVASPAYLKGRALPRDPRDLGKFDGIVMRSPQNGRIRQWTMRDTEGKEMPSGLRETLVVDAPSAMREAALLGMGITMLAVPDVLHALESGALVRLLPRWHADAGPISLYFSSRALLPAKTRAFVDWIVAGFAEQRLAARFAGSAGAGNRQGSGRKRRGMSA